MLTVRIRRAIAAASLVCASLCATSSLGATYYVDVDTGSDAWSGLLASRNAAGSDGPWQSLARISRQALVAGDRILLRCGQTWSETLRVNQSGTASAPIRIGANPAGCSNAPVIEGAIPVPQHSWVLDRSSVYRAALPANLVENGSLAQSVTKWTHWAELGNSTLAFNSNCPGGGGCLDFTSASGIWSLIISPNFPLQGAVAYTARFQVHAPAGTQLIAVVRRGGPTNFDRLGLNQSFTANGAWQQVVLPFVASGSAPNARFDVYVAGNRVRVMLRDVRVQRPVTAPHQVLMGTRTIRPGHHPNQGFNATNPQSVFLKNAADSNSVQTASGSGSTYVTTGSDLRLPTGTSLTAGLTVHVKSTNWHMDRRTITSVSGTRVGFDPPTRYRVLANWGYFLTGASWMVDSPDEWHFDQNGQLRVWMPDSAPPGGGISVATLGTGIDLSGRSNIVVEDVKVHAAKVGVSLFRSTAIALDRVEVSDTSAEGLDVRESQFCIVRNSVLRRTGLDAISGAIDGSGYAKGLQVRDSQVFDSGVQRIAGSVVSLPSPSWGAVNPGEDAVVTGNSVEGTAFIGIRSHGTSTIQDNFIGETCLTLNDCGGVVANYSGSGSVISGNLIENVIGSLDGTTFAETHAIGIYLDDFADGTAVSDNTVVNGDYGIQIHNAHNNLLSGNTLFGNRRTQLWLQEQSQVVRPPGDIYGNRVEGNTFFPTNGSASVLQESELRRPTDFASYRLNSYSGLLSPVIVSEIWPGGSQGYTLSQWQTAIPGGLHSASDVDGRVVSALGYASFRVTGSNIVPNGNTIQGKTGWTSWNQTAPLAQLVAESCSGVPCLRFVAGASESLLSTPNFSTTKDQWYRVSFDAKTGLPGQSISVLVRRGGGGTAGYEPLTSATQLFTGNTQITRYSYVFKAVATVVAGNPVTRELGARIDFVRVQPNQTLWVTNVEMIPLSPIEVGLSTALLRNTDTNVNVDVGCPDAATAPSRCGHYIRFANGSPVVWPVRLPPLGKDIVYTRDQSLLDSDADGIADSQDRCPSTPAGTSVQSNGCAIGQVPN